MNYAAIVSFIMPACERHSSAVKNLDMTRVVSMQW